MNRNEKRKARIVALQVIYANEISKVDPDSMLSYIADELDVGNQSSILNYSMELINLTIDNKSEIAKIIISYSNLTGGNLKIPGNLLSKTIITGGGIPIGHQVSQNVADPSPASGGVDAEFTFETSVPLFLHSLPYRYEHRSSTGKIVSIMCLCLWRLHAAPPRGSNHQNQR